jgi:ribA/ribD-fused uncharacterized protein
MAIRFYSTKKEYGEFSNFAAFPFVLGGLEWPTSEHYFQAQKFQQADYREKIRQTASPMIAARLGRSRSVPIRPDWEAVKLDVMRAAVFEKFRAHAKLAKLLLDTGDEELIEDAAGDGFWGCSKDGLGQNWLGKILMEVRQRLRAERDAST